MGNLARSGCLILLIALAPAAAAQVTIEEGGLWSIEGRVTVKACLADQCTSDRAAVQRDLYLSQGSRVDVGLSVGACVLDPEELDGLTTYTPTRRGGLKVRVTDRQRLAALLRSCSGYAGFRFMSARGQIMLAADRRSFDSTIRVAFSVRAQGHTIAINATTKVHGMLLEAESEGIARSEADTMVAPSFEMPDLVASVIERLR
jgi:hypothetical protein